MYIEPNTNIRILRNVPLDTTYEHTIFFELPIDQANYFISKQKYNLTSYTYQRVNKGVARVGIPTDNLYDCNYLMFQNTAFGSKWFYAFITAVEYVNNECAQITYEIDVMQTWHFDYHPDMCFVEREHSAYDRLFENLVPENLELGDYTVVKTEDVDMMPMNICILTSKEQDGSAAKGRTINHIYTALDVIAGIPADDYQSINSEIERYVGEGQEDVIVTMYQYPAWLGDASTSTPSQRIMQTVPDFTNVDGYVPKNKKLFSYPYCMLTLSNNNGQTADYKWEQFDLVNDGATFNFTGTFISTPCVLAYPVQYRGINNDYDSGLTMSNFPQNAWVGDTYKAWLAQNKGTIATSMLSSAIAVGAGVAVGSGVVGGLAMRAANGANIGTASAIGQGLNTVSRTASIAGVAGVNDILSLIGKTQDLKNTPPQVHGQVQCDSLNAGMGRFKYTFYHTCIRAQFAQIIDEFFNAYGYATRRIKTPNRNQRPHWNYVKTVRCTLTGSVPADDMKALCSIYDKGVTFWRNGDEVGDYSLDNSPINP